MLDVLRLLGTGFVVVTVPVLIHYEFLYHLTTWQPRWNIKPRYRFALRVFGALLAHTLEVCIFAMAYYFLLGQPGWGSLAGNFDGSLRDCVYFSFVTFTTLGYGDIQPMGAIRFLTGFEALTGLLLVTWTASFLYLAMQQFWTEK